MPDRDRSDAFKMLTAILNLEKTLLPIIVNLLASCKTHAANFLMIKKYEYLLKIQMAEFLIFKKVS